jgi:hypothetical protein
MNYKQLNESIDILDKLNDSSETQFDKKGCDSDLFVKSPFGIFILLSIPILISLQNMNHTSALTQFYISLPDIIYDLNGVTFSVEISDYKNSPIVSWTYNGSMFVPDKRTIAIEPNYDHLHLDNNDFLLAIKDSVEPGTRLYICADIPYPNEQYECQWDAVDKNHTRFAGFDFYFQSHNDITRGQLIFRD